MKTLTPLLENMVKRGMINGIQCGQTFLGWEEFDVHVNRHLQKHLDEYTPKMEARWEAFSNIHEGMNRDLFKVFEKYNSRLGGKVVLCLWQNGQLNCALCET